MSDIVQSMERIVGLEGLCPWEAIPTDLQSQIAQAISVKSHPQGIVYPSTAAELAEVLACVHANGWRILACGRGSKLHWGGLAEGVQLVVSTARLNRLIEHAIGDLTVTVEAGMPLARLQAQLAEQGQFLAIDPHYGERATLGGIVATADTGAWRQRYGGLRDMVIGLSVVRSDGQLAKAGGRVVKNVAGYDLMKLFTGSYGTLGLISQVTLRIYPLPETSRTVLFTGEAAAIAKATATLLNSALTPTAIDLLSAQTLDALGTKAPLGLLSRFQSIEASVEKQAEQLQQVGDVLGLNCQILREDPETALWQQLRELMEAAPPEGRITCKIGVLPSKAVETIAELDTLTGALRAGRLHAGCGLGMLRFAAEALDPQTLLTIRQRCEAQGGFLTILEAPAALKSTLDIWGAVGNSLDVMKRLKQQFDPAHILSPGRFVGGL